MTTEIPMLIVIGIPIQIFVLKYRQHIDSWFF